MKLLSWMRTIKKNGLDLPKEFKDLQNQFFDLQKATNLSGGLCCLRAQVSSQVQDIRTNSFSFSRSSHHDPKPLGVEERFDEDGFQGFLAIGTLGTDPETPKFTASITEEDVTGEKKEMAKLITEKLNKILEEYPKVTDIKPTPKEGYDLFTSSIELTKRSNEAVSENKRANEVKKKKSLLSNLFNKRKTVEGEHGTRDLIKRSSSNTRNDDNDDDNDDDDDDEDDESMPKKKDLRKSGQSFQSKVHPVLYTPTREDNKIDDRIRCTNRGDIMVPSLTGGFISSSSISESNRKRENWIKTDTEYLVLEL